MHINPVRKGRIFPDNSIVSSEPIIQNLNNRVSNGVNLQRTQTSFIIKNLSILGGSQD